MSMPDLITVQILIEDGSIIRKEIVFKENSDNIFAFDEFLEFISENEGIYQVDVTHYDEK